MDREDRLEKAIIVGVILPHTERWEVQASLDELALLADTAGAQVIRRVVQDRERPDPAFYVGRGKAEDLASAAERLGAELIIFNDELSPAQLRNLEEITKVKIVDRSGLILDIFARRARTREAKTQVELAQLQYLLPRLTRRWTHLSRQLGGIGTRGPGETQLEVDRRRVRRRISTLSKALSKIEGSRRTRRKRRERMFRAALVGYTNSGKSTLLNNLSKAAHAFVEDRLFATLDPMTRVVLLPFHTDRPCGSYECTNFTPTNRRILLTDTVGFINKLPHSLIASFQSTLGEASEADLLLHVVDVSHPRFEEQISTVEAVLAELEIKAKPIILVLNKVDLIGEQGLLTRIGRDYPGGILTSALNGWGMDDLREAISQKLLEDSVLLKLRIPQAQAGLLSRIHQVGEILREDYQENEVLLQAQVHRKDAEKMGLVQLKD